MVWSASSECTKTESVGKTFKPCKHCVFSRIAPVAVTDLVMTKEYFDNRHDKLVERNENQRTGWITEFFKQGRHKHLKGEAHHSFKL